MKTLIEQLLDLGIYAGLPKNARLPVRTVNAISFVGALGTLSAIGVSLFHADPWGLYLVPLLGFGFVVLLNTQRKYYLAGVLEVLVAIGTVLIFGSASDNSVWYLCLLPSIVFPFFIFSVEHKRTALVMSTVSLIVYVVMELLSSQWVMPWIELGVGAGMLAFAHLSKRSTELVELSLLEERATSERLLNNFLPAKIAKILRENGNKPPMIAERFEHVTVIFCDIVNFTPMSEKLSPEKLVAVLNQLFTEFDSLIEKYGLEKIKTIGDAYMVAGGVPNKMDNAEEAAADFALEMLTVVKRFDQKFHHGLDMRIGMHCGPVVAGVIGKQKFTYDMWGDTVNVAARMESHGLPGEIHISEDMADRLKDKYLLAQRGWVEVKGKGLLQTFWIKQKEDNPHLANQETVDMTVGEMNDYLSAIPPKPTAKPNSKSKAKSSPLKKSSKPSKSATVQAEAKAKSAAPKSQKKEARWAKKRPLRSKNGSDNAYQSKRATESKEQNEGSTAKPTVTASPPQASATPKARKKFWEQ